MHKPIPNKLTKSTVVETGLSEFHKLIATVMKSYSPQRTSNIVTYRKYTNLTNSNLLMESLSIFSISFKVQIATINSRSFHNHC